MASTAQRHHVASLWHWLIDHQALIGYSQGSHRWDIVRLYERDVITAFAEGGSFSPDCSSLATAVCKWAGLKDPNGQTPPYTAGFTGTMLATLPHYTDPEAANIGALVVWRSQAKPDGHHVAQVIAPGKDPLCGSHGSAAGPLAVRLSAETEAQKRMHGPNVETVFCNISNL